MKIRFGKIRHKEVSHAVKFGPYQIDISDTNAISFKVGNVLVFIEGSVYYAIDDERTITLSRENSRATLQSMFHKHGADNFPRHVEGTYVGCWINESDGMAGLFADPLNRLPFYLKEQEKGELIASTDLREVVDSRNALDQHSLYSYLVLGYPGARDTLYEGVKRLGSDETIRFDSNGFHYGTHARVRKVRQFNSHDMTRYESLVNNAVGARSSTSNVVMNSGGWDSTSLTYLLTCHRDVKSISAAVFDVVLPDGQSFNSYEVDKATRIGKFFGIATDRAIIDYRDPSLVDYWQSRAENFRNNHTYFWVHHLKIADLIGKDAQPGTRVFNGEACDSIHNFGFSQFVSVSYDNMHLREYADKAKSYLYGPTFFESMVNGRHADDKVLQFFQNYYGENRFEGIGGENELGRRRSYFEAFMLSYPRVPFAKWQMPTVASDGLQESFGDHLHTVYFKDIVREAQPETLYYWLLQLYRRFHFHSFQIAVTPAALRPHRLDVAMPFLDSQLVEYMYEMPEDWGRGLELRTTKYPLRHLAEHKWRMPVDILMEKGPHSYIAEADRRWSYSGGSWNIYCEIMFKSVFSPYFKDVLRKASLESTFDPALFNVSFMKQVVDRYVRGEECVPDVSLLFRLGVLLSIGFLR